jgi:hypothetical protein
MGKRGVDKHLFPGPIVVRQVSVTQIRVEPAYPWKRRTRCAAGSHRRELLKASRRAHAGLSENECPDYLLGDRTGSSSIQQIARMGLAPALPVGADPCISRLLQLSQPSSSQLRLNYAAAMGWGPGFARSAVTVNNVAQLVRQGRHEHISRHAVKDDERVYRDHGAGGTTPYGAEAFVGSPTKADFDGTIAE